MPNLNLQIDSNFDQTLQDMVDTKGQDSQTKADVIRRAVATYKYLKDEELKGKKITVQGDAGEQVVELP